MWHWGCINPKSSLINPPILLNVSIFAQILVILGILLKLYVIIHSNIDQQNQRWGKQKVKVNSHHSSIISYQAVPQGITIPNNANLPDPYFEYTSFQVTPTILRTYFLPSYLSHTSNIHPPKLEPHYVYWMNPHGLSIVVRLAWSVGYTATIRFGW